ncbi:phosphonate metabolism protein/1,5-bisphosphokinase (PRPP-forming) PhnN [Dyella humicola]|uniref:phosphonate metabolism protein/1,5-bisphosphokinase (PRPP-forming) PhnN n=1 Tax=Dyella humicola TaxID=2992126 RepID=UPI00224F4168|nr:phosphonate metabolism protein/1,5-bisphosphokinase (PRPP-forming) PhnN [Dyella humicola]
MSAGRLYYVMGPSGAGKDSVLGWVRDNSPSYAVVCAHRYITRSAQQEGDLHVALSAEEFERRERRGLFALTWQAHGLRCGLGKEIEHWLRQGVNVLVNGSRNAFPLARARFHDMVPVLITASRESIAHRLMARGRETAEQIEERLARNDQYVVPGDALTIINDGSLPEVGAALLCAIRSRA